MGCQGARRYQGSGKVPQLPAARSGSRGEQGSPGPDLEAPSAAAKHREEQGRYLRRPPQRARAHRAGPGSTALCPPPRGRCGRRGQGQRDHGLLGCSWAAPGLFLGCSWAAPARVWQREPLDVTAGLLLPAGLGVPRILQTLPLLSGLARSRSLSLWPCLVPLLLALQFIYLLLSV